MSKFMDDLINEAVNEAKLEAKIEMLVDLVKDGLLSVKDAAARADMTIEEFEKIAEQIK